MAKLYRGWIIVDRRSLLTCTYVTVGTLYRTYTVAEDDLRGSLHNILLMAEIRSDSVICNRYYIRGYFKLKLDPELKIWRSVTADT